MTRLEIEINKAIMDLKTNGCVCSSVEMAYAAAGVAKKYIDLAMTYGYHAAKDEEKGIRSQGYGTRFYERYLTEGQHEANRTEERAKDTD
jgi:hypothetical protein